MAKALPIKLSTLAIGRRDTFFGQFRESILVRRNIILYAALVSLVIAVSAIVLVLNIVANPLGVQSVESTQKQQVVVGPGTQALLTQLQQNGLNLNPVMTVHKTNLSVPGTLFTVHGDNIQIFEYPNNSLASADALKLRAMYSKNSQQNAWGSMVHIYTKDNLVIFYMGYNTVPSKALDLILGK
ncbi:MAG: hypothetical protein JWO50_727 [Candidatus Kaiserbacteria bacterium]|nr:hypothetical protein [Candidatus Kaiserbacteria bacterium]